MKLRIKSRLIASHVAVALIAAVAASIYLSISFERLQVEYHKHSLLSSAFALADALETDFGTPHGLRQAKHALRKLAAGDPGRYAVVDSKGRVLAATTGSVREGSMLTGLEQVLNGTTQTVAEYGDERKGEHIVAAVPIERGGKVAGAVRAWVAEKDYRASRPPIKRITALAICGAIVVSVVISLALAQALIRPISRMRQLSRRIANGDLSVRVKETSGDELEELADDLNTMASRLQELESVRRDFVGNVSHELRSPVSNIRVTSEVLERRAERLGDDSARLFTTIIVETERLESMIDEIMELSAIEASAMPLDKEVFELKPMLEELLESTAPRASQKNLTIGLLADPGISIVGDRNRLARAVQSLLHNAIKFTPDGGQIAVSARRYEGQTVVEVTDSGDGIATEDLPRVFERFYRADKARQRQGGTGIGLSIVKHTAEAHGGTAEVYSEEGRGSTFRIRLPYH